MKKILLTSIILGSALLANNNIGFLANQKYICVTQGYLSNDKFIPTSQEEGMKYPIRFYIDDNKVMHTDGKLTLTHLKENRYSDGDNSMGIMVENDKRYLMVSNKQLQALGSTVLYVCVETDNWTIAR